MFLAALDWGVCHILAQLVNENHQRGRLLKQTSVSNPSGCCRPPPPPGLPFHPIFRAYIFLTSLTSWPLGKWKRELKETGMIFQFVSSVLLSFYLFFFFFGCNGFLEALGNKVRIHRDSRCSRRGSTPNGFNLIRRRWLLFSRSSSREKTKEALVRDVDSRCATRRERKIFDAEFLASHSVPAFRPWSKWWRLRYWFPAATVVRFGVDVHTRGGGGGDDDDDYF